MERKKLSKYHRKRAPGVTNEPFGDEATSVDNAPLPAAPSSDAGTETGAFVIHLHDATRRHYDVRLEIGGVLMSFAVPKGPSLDPGEKILAVKTEDHPIEYLEFEDVIPAGQYGAGSMIVWDRGGVKYVEGPAEKELVQGKLHVELHGMKLRGHWAFVKLARGETGSEWLLFKKQDAEADPTRKILEELPRSVLSGLTVEELERRDEIGRALVDRAIALGARQSDTALSALLEREKSPLLTAESRELERSRASRKGRRPVFYDADLDGVRVLAVRDGDVVTLRTWNLDAKESIEAFYPEVVRALRALPVTRIAVDGTLVAFDRAGHPSLPLLAQRVARIAKGETYRAVALTPVVLVASDLLFLDADVTALPIESRRDLLSSLLPSLGFLRAASPLEGDESRILSTCASLGIASVVSKTRGSSYGPGSWTQLLTGAAPRSRSAVDHGAADARTALKKVVVSNRDKVFWPEEPTAPQGRFTKGDLVDYYANIADVILPYLKNRPVIVVRYPDGIHGKSFFQWNVPVGMPPWVRTMTMHEVDDFVAVPGDRVSQPPPPPSSRKHSVPPSAKAPGSQKTPKRVFLVDDAQTLVYMANLGMIPLHVLGSRAPDLTRSDFLTLDFDVKQSELRHAITLARTLHALLDEIGLVGLPKTSGQTGLHVLVPLGPNQSFDTARALADLLGRLLVEQHPDIATMDRIVNRRGNKVYVDTGQTGTSRAIVAPYSVRAVAGATVSTPLSWDEVTKDLDPRAFTIKTVPPRIAKRGDLLAGLLGSHPDVMGAVGKLSDVVPRSIGRPL